MKRLPLAAGLGLTMTLGLPAAANAATVGTTPASWTPYLLKSPVSQVVEELEPCNGTMYAVGTMTAVGRGTATYSRSNALSFSATTGVMTSWAPQVNGPVRSIAFSPDCSTAPLGGTFSRVNGVAATNLVAVSTSTGALLTGFAHNADAAVNTVRYTHGALVIGGALTIVNGANRTKMASLNPTTGAATSYLNLAISGAYPNTGQTRVYDSHLSHGGDKLLIVGVFTSIGGQSRQQAAVLDLGGSTVGVDGGRRASSSRAASRAGMCARGHGHPTTAASISRRRATSRRPDRARARVTRAQGSATAFPATATSVNHLWINYTGCDSYYSVAADADNVYVSGHERWANNSNGCDYAGPGAVSRPGIASMDPRTGLVTAWNPTRSLGVGSHQLLVTSAGLWVASDTWKDGNAQMCGGQLKHGGVCFLPY